MRERATREAQHEDLTEAPAATVEPPAHEKYVTSGHAPPVADAGDKHADRTASQLAFEEDGNVRELKTKVGALVQSKFGGDYKKAFAHYDTNQDGGVDKGELVQLLSDAGVGNGITRGTWASKIIEKLDTTGDSKIEWSEFETVFTAAA